jgi:ketosteroid isomerase-like protein
MPCAGQPYASEMCCVFEVRDGLVVREHDYIDRSPTSA